MTCRGCGIKGDLPWMNWCRDCENQSKRKWRDEHREEELERARRYEQWAWYGLSLEERDEMFVEQFGLCKLCSTPEVCSIGTGRLQTEHCHTCLFVRGLVCHRCNGLISHHEKGQYVPAEFLDLLDEYIDENCSLKCRVRRDVGIRARKRHSGALIP